MATRKYKKGGKHKKEKKQTPKKSRSSSRYRKRKQRLTGLEERAKDYQYGRFNGRPYE